MGELVALHFGWSLVFLSLEIGIDFEELIAMMNLCCRSLYHLVV
jgi:hypothetical protein